MGYPQLVNWAKIRKNENGSYSIKDFIYGDEYKISKDEARFMIQLNGKTDPYAINSSLTENDISEVLEVLDGLGFLREGRFISKSLFEIIYTLWIPHITKKFRIAAKIINALLRVLWLPVPVISLIMLPNAAINDDFFQFMSGLVFGTMAGMVLHEFGHMFACLAYGGRVFEAGVILKWLMPGAYVMIDTSPIKVRMQRIQVDAAGIEMNILLAGIFGIIACCLYEYGSFFAAAAINNLVLGLMNLMLISNLDGMNIMGELLGIEGFVEKAKKALKSRKFRKTLARKGASGKATVTACVVICIAQIALPIIIAINILGVFGWTA